jgi:protein-tyrosine phosphatase
MINTPIPESYWVVPGKFLAGAYPIANADDMMARRWLSAFIDAGINSFFDLTRPGELQTYLPALQEEAFRHGIPIDYQRMTIQDKGLPAHEKMVVLLDGLDAALASGHTVYLHCWGGIGRTGTTVGCWLVRHGLTGGQALIRLNELYRTADQSHIFPRSPETDAQVKFILDWVEGGLA